MSNIRPVPGMPGFVIGDPVEKKLPSCVREFLVKTGRLLPAALVKARPPLVWLDSPPTLRIDPNAHHLRWTLEDAGIGPDFATLISTRTT